MMPLFSDPALLLLFRRISITSFFSFPCPVNLGLIMGVLTGVLICLLREDVSHDLIQGLDVGGQPHPLNEMGLYLLRQIIPWEKRGQME